MPDMPPADSYLQQRQSERRWRVVTALVVAGAMAAGAVWTLTRHGDPQPSAGRPAAAAPVQTAEVTCMFRPDQRGRV
jgi:hypothetical protein